MTTIILIASFIACIDASPFDYFYQDCGFSQKDAFECMNTRIDANNDGGITRNEFSDFMSKQKNKLFTVLKWIGGVSHVFQKCDYDMNGEITARDMKMAKGKCFAIPFHRCLLKRVCK